jgi:Abnormal spindle-like microcephaly-assoc'd, ASPM-SPD-2-Hydin
MKLPQSIAQRLSLRIFSVIATSVMMLPLCARAATEQLTCAPSSLSFGAVPVGQTETQVVILTNSGATSVTVSAVNLSGTEFTLSQSQLPLLLPAGQSAALSLTFSPTQIEQIGETAKIASNASNPSLPLQLAGRGVASDAVTASPSAISFGNVAVGATSTVPVVLTNDRSWKVTLSALQVTGSGFSVSGPAFPVTLSAGQSITLNLTFAPQSAGTSAGRTFVYGPALAIPLEGTGTMAGQLSISPSLLNFGNVPVGTTEIETITMSATGASVIVSSDASTSSQFFLSGASFPFTIAPGQSASFNVAFAPQSSGTVSGSLSFASNASNPVMLETLSGTGTVTSYTVSLWWNASTSEVNGYNIYRSTTLNGTFAKINSALDANTAYTDSTVVSGQTYYYEATSVNSNGQESAPSTPAVEVSIP